MSKYKIGTEEFSSKEKVRQKCKQIIRHTKDVVGPDDEAFMLTLFKHHPDHEVKLSDFGHLTIGLDPHYQRNQCFYAVRKAGGTEDISYEWAIKHMKPEATAKVWEVPFSRMVSYDGALWIRADSAEEAEAMATGYLHGVDNLEDALVDQEYDTPDDECYEVRDATLSDKV